MPFVQRKFTDLLAVQPPPILEAASWCVTTRPPHGVEPDGHRSKRGTFVDASGRRWPIAFSDWLIYDRIGLPNLVCAAPYFKELFMVVPKPDGAIEQNDPLLTEFSCEHCYRSPDAYGILEHAADCFAVRNKDNWPVEFISRMPDIPQTGAKPCPVCHATAYANGIRKHQVFCTYRAPTGGNDEYIVELDRTRKGRD